MIRQFVDRLSKVALAAALCTAPVVSTHAAMDVLFDYAAPKEFSGSGSTMRYYFSGGAQDVGVSVSGWQAPSNYDTFRNRTHRIRTGDGIGLDVRESGDENLIDNEGRMDLIVFEFDEMVSIDEVNLGEVGDDFDFTLLAFTGDGSPTLENRQFGYEPSNSSKQMLNQGWELAGHYGRNETSASVNEVGLVSSVWAIGAYTSVLTDSSRSYGLLGQGNDYFALMSLAGERIVAAAVSEPPMLALMALLALMLLRRRRTQTV